MLGRTDSVAELGEPVVAAPLIIQRGIVDRAATAGSTLTAALHVPQCGGDDDRTSGPSGDPGEVGSCPQRKG
jgi:hypothetical protein